MPARVRRRCARPVIRRSPCSHWSRCRRFPAASRRRREHCPGSWRWERRQFCASYAIPKAGLLQRGRLVVRSSTEHGDRAPARASRVGRRARRRGCVRGPLGCTFRHICMLMGVIVRSVICGRSCCCRRLRGAMVAGVGRCRSVPLSAEARRRIRGNIVLRRRCCLNYIIKTELQVVVDTLELGASLLARFCVRLQARVPLLQLGKLLFQALGQVSLGRFVLTATIHLVTSS